MLSGPFRFDVENIITPISKYRMYNQQTRTVRETMRYLTVHQPTRASSEEEKSSGTKYVRNEKLLVNCLRVKRQHSSQATRKWLHRRGPRWLQVNEPQTIWARSQCCSLETSRVTKAFYYCCR